MLYHTCPQYISRKFVKFWTLSLHRGWTQPFTCIFMHWLEGFLNPSLNIWLFHLSRKRPQWTFSYWNRAIGTGWVTLLVILHCATCFLSQHLLWSAAYTSKWHGVTSIEAAFTGLLKIVCCSSTAQFLSLVFKLLMLLSQHLFLNDRIKGHNHNYITSTDKISPPLLIIITVESTTSCPLHFGGHLRWFWAQWKVNESDRHFTEGPVPNMSSCNSLHHISSCTLGPLDSLRNNKHFILSK